MGFPIIIKLKKPLVHGDEEKTEIKILREPVAGDMRDMDANKQTLGDMLQVLSRISDMPLPILNKMSVKDLMQINPIMSSFFGDGL